VGLQAPASLGGDEDLIIFTLLEQPAYEPLAAAVAVDVSGV
jgi:hypothetical protein